MGLYSGMSQGMAITLPALTALRKARNRHFNDLSDRRLGNA